MQTSKIIFSLSFLLFITGCKKSIRQNDTIKKDMATAIHSPNNLPKTNKNATDSFTISCGSGCAMTYTEKNSSGEFPVIKVKFNVDMYVDEALTDSYDEIYIFSYNDAGQLERVNREGSTENVLETLMPDSQESFKNFGNSLIKNRTSRVSTNKNCIKESELSLPYNSKIDIKTVKYEKLSCSSIKGFDKFICNQDQPRYISLPKKDDIIVVLVPQDCGDFPYRFYLLTIKNDLIVDNLYVEGEWYEPDDEENKEVTSFSLDSKYSITVKTQYLTSSKLENYKIADNGKILKQ